MRGRTGLTKGTWLFLAIATPTVIDTLAHPSTTGWSGILLPAVQDFAFALTLGFLADREVLIRQKLSSARLADVHNLGSVAAWGSSIALALATGIATIIIGGLQPFVIGVIHLPATPTPPAVVNPTAK